MDTSVAALSGYQAVQWPNTTTTKKKTGQATIASSSGDSVSISESAQELSKLLGQANGASSGSSSEESDPVAKLKKQIEEMEKKITKVQQSSLPDEPKKAVVEGLEKELAALNQQLAQLLAQTTKGGSGGSASGSAKTAAKG